MSRRRRKTHTCVHLIHEGSNVSFFINVNNEIIIIVFTFERIDFYPIWNRFIFSYVFLSQFNLFQVTVLMFVHVCGFVFMYGIQEGCIFNGFDCWVDELF